MATSYKHYSGGLRAIENIKIKLPLLGLSLRFLRPAGPGRVGNMKSSGSSPMVPRAVTAVLSVGADSFGKI